MAETPESVIARTRKENDLGVGYYQPYSQACRSGGPCFFSLYPHLYRNACAFFLWRE